MLDVDMCPSGTQLLQLMKIKQAKDRLEHVGTLRTNLVGLGAFANGERVFAPATGSLLSIKSPVLINLRQHTFFLVMNHGKSGDNLRHIAAPLSAHAAASPGFSPRYGLRRDVSSLHIWLRGTSDDNRPYHLNAAVAPTLAGRTALRA